MPARARKKTETPKVDETVENQENPGTNEEDRSEDSNKDESPVAKMAPAMEVDETVQNQMNPGTSEVNRNPDPQLVSDGVVTRDVNKAHAELVDPDADEKDAEKARIRQEEAAMNAADWREDNDELITITFILSGLTGAGHVWKAGESHHFEEAKAEEWMLLTEAEQQDRYGKVFFERR